MLIKKIKNLLVYMINSYYYSEGLLINNIISENRLLFTKTLIPTNYERRR